MSFYDEPLRLLGNEPVEPVGALPDLRELKRHLDSILSMIEQNQAVHLTEPEQHAHRARYGGGAFVVGDFVVRRR